MIKITMKTLFGAFICCWVSCTTTKTKDAKSLYSEVEQNNVPNTLSKEEKDKGWKLLFDGKTNGGWHGYNLNEFPDSWVIEDGALTMTTQGSEEGQDITSDKVYNKFALAVDFKLTRAANSGILFQVAESPKYKYSYETGPEFQVIDHQNWPDSLEGVQICGANYGMYPPLKRPYKAIGEWNRCLLLVDGNNVTQILNGEIVVNYTKNSEEWKKLRDSGKWKDFPDWEKFDDGHISLQNHGTRVYYRNIKINELQ